MKKIKIDYLMPVLVTYEGQEYVCFVDYAKNNVYSLIEMDENIKSDIHELVLRQVNNDAITDVKDPDVVNNSRITQIISDINNDTLRKKFNDPIIKEKTNE